MRAWFGATSQKRLRSHPTSRRWQTAIPHQSRAAPHELRMSQPISVDTEAAGGTPPEGSEQAGEPVSQTALDCLAKIAAYHGVDLSVERLRHTYAVSGIPVSTTQLLRMAKDVGLRAKRSLLDWSALVRLGEAYPALVHLTNGNWVVVLRAGPGPDGAEAVSVFDPLAERQDEPLVVSKALFCTRWHGDTILIKREYLSVDRRAAFGVRWFVPELL